MREAHLDLNSFVYSNRADLIEAKDALVGLDFDSFESVLDRIENSPLVKRISSLASTSSDYLGDLIREFESATPGMKIIAGLSIVGAGAAVWGAKFALAPLLALCLIAYGISIAVPAVWEMVGRVIDRWWEELPIS